MNVRRLQNLCLAKAIGCLRQQGLRRLGNANERCTSRTFNGRAPQLRDVACQLIDGASQRRRTGTCGADKAGPTFAFNHPAVDNTLKVE